MAIDKFVPRQLNTDVDQRYLQEGEMLDAINISFNEDGPNSQVVLKNERGTQAYLADTIADVIPNYPMTVIGTVSDSQRGRIYFFSAADTDDSDRYDHIYMLDMATQLYSIVFRSVSSLGTLRCLNFDPNSFIKADVLNRDFQRDGGMQSVIYFTDNINTPRKINVDRALSGDYQDYENSTTSEFDFVFSSAVGAPTREPSFSFDTDTDYNENNFSGKCFQFATQFIYQDGEESAVSPYSLLAFLDEGSSTNIISSDSTPIVLASPRNENNICLIDTKFSNTLPFSSFPAQPSALTPEVVQIRLLGREDNDGAWFVIDEFDPRQNLERVKSDGGSEVVYSAGTGVYRFKNQGSYRAFPTLVTDKLYDNVPRLARGQAISGNRLVYSNYLEGYNNQNTELAKDVRITPVYSNPDLGQGNGDISQNFVNDNNIQTNGDIVVDFTSIFTNLNFDDEVEEGSRIAIEFEWRPRGTVLNATDEALLQYEGTDSVGNRVCYGTGMPNEGSDYNVRMAKGTYTFYFNYQVQEGDTVAIVAQAFATHVENLSWGNQYTDEGIKIRQLSNAQDNQGLGGDTSSFNDASDVTRYIGEAGQQSVEVTQGWKFSTASANGVTTISPSMYFMSAYGDGDYITVEAGGGGIGGGSGGFDPGDLSDDWWNIQFQNNGFQNSQSSEDYVWTGTQILNEAASSSQSSNTETSFKAGSSHYFGMMYYDEYNRNGPFISLGERYVDHLSERGLVTGKGAVGMEFYFNQSLDEMIPDWAKSYKILYGGSQYQSLFTGVVADAFVVTDAYHQGATGATASEYDPNKRHIYVSIQNIEDMQSEMDVNTSYDFAEGDVLRVYQYYTAQNGDVNYPSSQQGNIIEFNVVKTVILEDDYNNPLRTGTYNYGELRDNGKVGRFLVLQAPEVDAGLDRYEGFDWFSVAETQNTSGTAITYPGSPDTATAANYWKQECAIEIVSKKPLTERRLYYEITDYKPIGQPRAIQGEIDAPFGHGRPIITYNGDVFFKPSISNINSYSGGSWSSDPSERIYKSVSMESEKFSDKRTRKDWGRGRAHIPIIEDQQRRRENSITYSEAVVDDLNTLYTSSFDKNLSNYLDLNSSYGAVNYIGGMGEELFALQENKVSRLSVDRQVIKSAGGSDVGLALDSSPFNIDIYFSGDYGVGNNPESVLIQDGQLFFADVSRSAICRLASSQLYAISEKNTKNLFNNRFNTFRAFNNGKIVSGYNPDTDVYYVTFLMGVNSDTIGYSVYGGSGGDGAWISRYTFYPDIYSNQDNTMVSAYYYDPDTQNDYDQQLFYSHNGGVYNTFYGQFDQSDFTYVSKMDPSRVKVYDVMSHEGNSNNWAVQSINTNLMGANDNAGTLAFVEKEGSYFAYITRDPGGSKHVRKLGTIDSSTSDTITFQGRINNISVPANAELMAVSGGNTVTLSTGAPESLVQSLDNSKTVSTLR